MYLFKFPLARSLLFLFLCEICIVSPWVLQLHSLSVLLQFAQVFRHFRPFPLSSEAEVDVNCDRSFCYCRISFVVVPFFICWNESKALQWL